MLRIYTRTVNEMNIFSAITSHCSVTTKQPLTVLSFHRSSLSKLLSDLGPVSSAIGNSGPKHPHIFSPPQPQQPQHHRPSLFFQYVLSLIFSFLVYLVLVNRSTASFLATLLIAKDYNDNNAVSTIDQESGVDAHTAEGIHTMSSLGYSDTGERSAAVEGDQGVGYD